MESVRTGENWRESWWVTNTTNSTIAIGDLQLLPALAPGQRVDVLHYYTRERISHAATLVALLKSGKLRLKKQKSFTNSFPGDVAAADADEAVTPAEENEVSLGGRVAHTHDNLDILDDFSTDSNEGLVWRGSPIEGVGGGTDVHNDLTGLQGGSLTLDEYYHLEYSEYNSLTGGPDENADHLHSHSGITNIDGGHADTVYGGVGFLADGGDAWGLSPSA